MSPRTHQASRSASESRPTQRHSVEAAELLAKLEALGIRRGRVALRMCLPIRTLTAWVEASKDKPNANAREPSATQVNHLRHVLALRVVCPSLGAETYLTNAAFMEALGKVPKVRLVDEADPNMRRAWIEGVDEERNG